jgi:hypothetical protein
MSPFSVRNGISGQWPGISGSREPDSPEALALDPVQYSDQVKPVKKAVSHAQSRSITVNHAFKKIKSRWQVREIHAPCLEAARK